MQPPNKSADSHEIRPLTGIRGLAAMAVVLFHFYSSWVLLLPSLKVVAPLALRGGLGVDLFFILSGFILSYVYNVGDSRMGLSEYRRFLWYRLARILPNHLATLVMLMILIVCAKRYGVTLTGDYPLSGLPFQITMTHAWPFINGGKWNYPSWTISAEWFAYLCVFPISWNILKFRFSQWASVAIAYIILFMLVFALPDQAFLHFHALLQVSCEFIAGSMLFGAYLHAGSVTRACHNYGTFIFLVIIGLLLVDATCMPFASVVVILLFPLLLLGLTSETSIVSRIVSTPPALWLGRISYALYMSHAITQKVIKILLPPEQYVNSPLLLRLLILFANILFLLLVAAGLYYAVEIPARNLMRQIAISWSRRRSQSSSAS